MSEVDKAINVIGMGMSPADLTEGHLHLIRQAQLLVGGRRHLAAFADLGVETREIDKDLAALTAFIRERMGRQRIVVLASGDPLYFGIGTYLCKTLGREALRFHPNVNAVAAAFARIGEPWQDAAVVSLHGRDQVHRLQNALTRSTRVAVFTDHRQTSSWLGQWLQENGWQDVRICVLEKMGGPDERISWHTPAEAAHIDFAEPNLAVLAVRTDPDARPQGASIGMPETCFTHDAGLITKAEVRAVVVSKLRLAPGQVIWDLGAGSGAVGIEASFLVPGGRVIAVEKHSERIDHIRRNRERHGAMNLEIIHGEMPQCLSDLPEPDRIFVGGGGSALEATLQTAAVRLRSGGMVVVNTVLLSSLETAQRVLAEAGMAPEVCQIQISRGVSMSGGHRLQAENPVWIVTGVKP